MQLRLSLFIYIGMLMISVPLAAQYRVGGDGKSLDANQRVGSNGINSYRDPLAGYNRNYPFGDNLGGGNFRNRWSSLRISGHYEEERFFKRDLQFEDRASRGWDLYDERLRNESRFRPNHPSQKVVSPQERSTRPLHQRIDGRVPDRRLDRPDTRIHDEFIELLKLEPISKIAQDIGRLSPTRLRGLMESYQKKRIEKDKPFSEQDQVEFDSLLDELDELLE